MNYKIKLIVYSIIFSSIFIKADAFERSASLFISKPAQNIEVGDRITISIKAQSTEQSINAVSGSVSFPEDRLRVIAVSKSHSIVNLWTREPSLGRNRVSFEGIILNPGYLGQSGNIFDITFETKRSGESFIGLSEGAVLANDGLGTNILDSLKSISLNILESKSIAVVTTPVYDSQKIIALPVITDYSRAILSKQSIFVKGKGEPNALTKISFKDTSQKSIGERFIEYLQTKKKRLTDVLVKNDASGAFQYASSSNLLTGAYNATPFLVDPNKNVEKPGLGVQLLVSDSKINHYIVVFINILGLLIPVVGLIVIIYFIPWYSWLRMRIIKKKIGLEEEKIEISQHQLKRQDEVQDIPAKHDNI